MKKTLPLLLASAALSHAQSYGFEERFAASFDYSNVAQPEIDYNGFTLGFRGRVVGNLGAFVTFTSSSSDTATERAEGQELLDLIDALTAAGSADPVGEAGRVSAGVDVDFTRFTVGLDYELEFSRRDSVTFMAAYGRTSMEGKFSLNNLPASVTAGLTDLSFSGDVLDGNQFILGVSYRHEFSREFAVVAGVTHYSNSVKYKNGADAIRDVLDSTFDKSVTAPSVALEYAPTRNFSIYLAYSTEDTLLGLPDADRTITAGVKASF